MGMDAAVRHLSLPCQPEGLERCCARQLGSCVLAACSCMWAFVPAAPGIPRFPDSAGRLSPSQEGEKRAQAP